MGIPGPAPVRRWTRRGASLIVGALLLGLPALANAGTFTSGTLGISIGPLGPVTVGSHPVAFSMGAGGSMTEPASVFGPTFVPLPRALFTGIPQLSGLSVTVANGTKTISAAGSPGGGLGGAGGLQGFALVNIVGLLNLTVPLTPVGVPSGFFKLNADGIILSVFGTGWGTGPQQLTGITTTTPSGAVVNTVTFTGSQLGTLSGNATVTLVSTFKVVTNFTPSWAGLAVQTLRFVPEPGTSLLLGTGVAGLVVVGVRKRRKRAVGPLR